MKDENLPARAEPGNAPAQIREAWTKEQVDLIKRTVAKGATDDELKLFLYQANRMGLDPLARQIHFTKRRNKDGTETAVFITAIDGYRLIADRTGKYAGNDEPKYEGMAEYGENGQAPLKATVSVWKMVAGQRAPFTGTAHWYEYYPGDGGPGFMWRKMPCLMLGKVAEALALRKAFPAELSGVYTDDEMAQAGQDNGHDSTPVVEIEAPGYPELKPYQEEFFSNVKALMPEASGKVVKTYIAAARDKWRKDHKCTRDILALTEAELAEIFTIIAAAVKPNKEA